MSEIYTLKQIQVDAARYRWLREHVYQFGAEDLYGLSVHMSSLDIDKWVDSELDADE